MAILGLFIQTNVSGEFFLVTVQRMEKNLLLLSYFSIRAHFNNSSTIICPWVTLIRFSIIKWALVLLLLLWGPERTPSIRAVSDGCCRRSYTAGSKKCLLSIHMWLSNCSPQCLCSWLWSCFMLLLLFLNILWLFYWGPPHWFRGAS